MFYFIEQKNNESEWDIEMKFLNLNRIAKQSNQEDEACGLWDIEDAQVLLKDIFGRRDEREDTPSTQTFP